LAVYRFLNGADMRKLLFSALLFPLILAACGNDVEKDEPTVTALNECLGYIEDKSKPARLAASTCRAPCADDDRVACGAMALAYLQDLVDELAPYLGLLNPSQGPSEWAAQSYELLNLEGRQFIEPFIREMVQDLRGIQEGVYHFVGGDSPDDGAERVIALTELPLHPGVLSAIYGKAHHFSVLGVWTEKEMMALGSIATAALAAIDLVFSQSLALDVNRFEGGSAAAMVESVIDIFDYSPNLLVVDRTDVLESSRDALHASLSWSAGRETSLENVSQANRGFLGAVEAYFAGSHADSNTVLQLTDIDRDGTLSRGDGMKLAFGVNEDVLEIAFPYPFSAALTGEFFAFLERIWTAEAPPAWHRSSTACSLNSPYPAW
jgi:hypothetical protein